MLANKNLENKDTKVWVDPETGLMWQIDIIDKKYCWKNAENCSKQLNLMSYGGYTDWRVPTRYELETLATIDFHKSDNSFKNKIFIKLPLLESMRIGYQSFWSLSQANTEEDGRSRAFLVNFWYTKGTKHSGYTNYSKYIRCVRL
jgi:hypothetical protein